MTDFAVCTFLARYHSARVLKSGMFNIVQYSIMSRYVQICPDMSSISPYLPLKVHVDDLCATVVPTPCIGQTNSSKNVLLIEEQCAATHVLGRSQQQNSAVFTKVQDSRSQKKNEPKEAGFKIQDLKTTFGVQGGRIQDSRSKKTS